MPKRQIKKTQISYNAYLNQQPKQIQNKNDEGNKQADRQRSRQKIPKNIIVEVVDKSSRKARLAALKKKQQESNQNNQIDKITHDNVSINVSNDLPQGQTKLKENLIEIEKVQVKQLKQKQIKEKVGKIKKQAFSEQQESDNENNAIFRKPIFLSKDDRNNYQHPNNSLNAQNTVNINHQNSQKALKYTTKLLLKENQKFEENLQQDEELIEGSSDEETRPKMPDDSDTAHEEIQYQLWKVRQLKRIRRDREERRRLEIQKAELERRRKMNNQEILLQNKVMGSDATDRDTETKYVYMQKYYHQGAFYRDSQDPIFNRDYNLPTPMQMQDKSMLPQILQRRKGEFGKKGQSKYKHLSAEDTTNFNPQYRQDQSILNNYKKKMAGYKGSGNNNL